MQILLLILRTLRPCQLPSLANSQASPRHRPGTPRDFGCSEGTHWLALPLPGAPAPLLFLVAVDSKCISSDFTNHQPLEGPLAGELFAALAAYEPALRCGGESEGAAAAGGGAASDEDAGGAQQEEEQEEEGQPELEEEEAGQQQAEEEEGGSMATAREEASASETSSGSGTSSDTSSGSGSGSGTSSGSDGSSSSSEEEQPTDVIELLDEDPAGPADMVSVCGDTNYAIALCVISVIVISYQEWGQGLNAGTGGFECRCRRQLMDATSELQCKRRPDEASAKSRMPVHKACSRQGFSP